MGECHGSATLRVENAHSKKTEVYEGVLVEDLLKKAGVEGEALRGQAMASYVLVEEVADGSEGGELS